MSGAHHRAEHRGTHYRVDYPLLPSRLLHGLH
ncbi:hypothetical protein [Segatella sp.]